jgi:hypothetical protein
VARRLLLSLPASRLGGSGSNAPRESTAPAEALSQR